MCFVTGITQTGTFASDITHDLNPYGTAYQNTVFTLPTFTMTPSCATICGATFNVSIVKRDNTIIGLVVEPFNPSWLQITNPNPSTMTINS